MIGSVDLDKLEQFCIKIKQGYSKTDAYREVYFGESLDSPTEKERLSAYNKITISQNAYLLTKRPEYTAMMKTIETELKNKKQDNKYNINIDDIDFDESKNTKEYTIEDATKDLRLVIAGCKKDIQIIDEGFEFEQNNLNMQLMDLLEKPSLTKEEQKQLTIIQRSIAKSLKTNKRNEKYYEIIGNTVNNLCKIYNITTDDDKNKTVEVVFKDNVLEV